MQLGLCTSQQSDFCHDDGSLTLLMQDWCFKSSQPLLDATVRRLDSIGLTRPYMSGQAIPLMDLANTIYPSGRRYRTVMNCQSVSASFCARRQGTVVHIMLIAFTISIFQSSTMATASGMLVSFSCRWGFVTRNIYVDLRNAGIVSVLKFEC